MASRLLLLVCSIAAAGATTTYISRDNLTWQEQVALYTCVGLNNRAGSTTPPAYIYSSGDVWLRLLENMTSPPPLTTPADFISGCLRRQKGAYILYNSTAQQALLPSIVTLAGVLDAVPIEAATEYPDATVCAFNALEAFPSGTTPLEATRSVYEAHVNATTGMSKLNPGRFRPTARGGCSCSVLQDTSRSQARRSCIPKSPSPHQ